MFFYILLFCFHTTINNNKLKKTLFLTVLSFVTFNLLAQYRLDVDGNAKIKGKLEVIQAVGDSSLFIGANAGMNDDGTQNRNTFIGTNAGKSNTTGASNTFVSNF